MRKLVTVFAAAFLATLLACAVAPRGLPTASAAVDRTPNNTVGAVYKASPSILNDGDWDVLHTDVNHNLFVNVRAGNISPIPSSTNPTPFTTTDSNGVTAVTLVSATASQVIIPWHLTITNEDTVAHRVRLLTSGGTAIEYFDLVPYGVYSYDGYSAGFSLRTLAGEGLQIDLPNFVAEGGTGTLVRSIGYTTKQ